MEAEASEVTITDLCMPKSTDCHQPRKEYRGAGRPMHVVTPISTERTIANMTARTAVGRRAGGRAGRGSDEGRMM